MPEVIAIEPFPNPLLKKGFPGLSRVIEAKVQDVTHGSSPPKLGGGIFLLTRREGPKPVYERVQCELAAKGIFHRMSVSPSEKKICFEFISFERQREIKGGEPGHTLYVADFDVRERAITNLKPFANEEGKPIYRPL